MQLVKFNLNYFALFRGNQLSLNSHEKSWVMEKSVGSRFELNMPIIVIIAQRYCTGF